MEKNNRAFTSHNNNTLNTITSTKFTHHPHDKFVKCALKNKEIAIDLFVAHWSNIDRKGCKAKGLKKEDLSNIRIGNNEYNEPGKPQTRSDIVYWAEIADCDYLFLTEHQSRSCKAMPLRMLEYVTSELREYSEQKHQGMPVVLPLCLYHSPTLGYKHPTMLESQLGGEPHISRSWLKFGFKLVDLTIIDDKEIENHGHAAILEWILKDAFLPGEKLLQRIKAHLIHPRYAAMGDQFKNFKDALYEYIISVYKGKKTADEVINELIQVLPQEEGIMKSAAQRLMQQGIQQGIQQGTQQVAKRMLAKKMDFQDIAEATGLSTEVLKYLELDEAKPTSLPPAGVTRTTDQLVNGMSSMSLAVEQTTSIENGIIISNTERSELEQFPQINPVSRGL